MSKVSEFKNGCLQELPLQLGVFPFGIAYGILGIEVGLTSIQTFLLSIIIFAGVSQIVFTQLFSIFTPNFIMLFKIKFSKFRNYFKDHSSKILSNCLLCCFFL